jgi:serine/threonine protein kinase
LCSAPVIDGFDNLETIGRGGFSTVYAADQVDLGRKVAIKVLNLDTGDEATRRRFLRECRVVGKLAGVRGITPVHTSAFTHDGRPCIVMEHMARGSLDEHIRRNGPLSPSQAHDAATVLAEALVRAHERRVVHRDIKPGNVLISATGDVALADFGIAVIDDLRSSTETNDSLSPPFSPPESFLGEAAGEPTVDVYSLGATIYFSLTGRAPFGTAADGGVVGLSDRVARHPVPPMERDDIPDEFEALIGQMLAKSPADRPQSMSVVVDRLRNCEPAAEPTGGPSAVVIPRPDDTGPSGSIDWVTSAVAQTSATDVHPEPAPGSGAIDWVTAAFAAQHEDATPATGGPATPPVYRPTAPGSAGPDEPPENDLLTDEDFVEVDYPEGSWPTSSDYATAIQDPASLRHDDLKDSELDRDLLGMPMSAAGQSAIVFHLSRGSGPVALRCFTRPPAEGALRYRALARHLERHACPSLVPAVWLDEAIDAEGSLWPAVSMPWAPGLPLDVAIEDRLARPAELLTLSERWLEACEELRTARIAHGDLQHGNVLVDDLTIRLIDLDGVWVPSLADHPSRETGHPGFQHPWRDHDTWGPDLDAFSGALIHTTLLALAADPSLWRHHVGENLILGADDLRRPGATPAWIDLLQSPDAQVRRQASILEQCCASSDPPVGSARDLIESTPLFAAPAPTASTETAPVIDPAAPFVPVTPVVDAAADWTGTGASVAADETAWVNQMPASHGTTGGSGSLAGSEPSPSILTRPLISRMIIGAVSGLVAGVVALAAGSSNDDGNLAFLSLMGALAICLCLGMGWIGERAHRPGGAVRWAVQSLVVMGSLIAGALLIVSVWFGGLPITRSSGDPNTVVVTLCAATVGALVGLLPAQWMSVWSAALQSVAGLTGGAIAGAILAEGTEAVPGTDGNYILLDGFRAVLGGLVVGGLIGISLGLGHVVACRRCLVPLSGWRAGRWIPVGSRGGVIGNSRGAMVHVVGPDVQDAHARIDPVPAQHRTDQLTPIGPVWLDGQELTRGVVLPFGETTFHLGRPDGPAVVYRKA